MKLCVLSRMGICLMKILDGKQEKKLLISFMKLGTYILPMMEYQWRKNMHMKKQIRFIRFILI